MIEWVDSKKLEFAEYNPRSIKTPALERLKKSLGSEGGKALFERRPILVNKRDGKLVVYAGNQRLKAARELGFKEVPVIVDEISIQEEKERNIKDNLSVGEWDSDLLENNFDLKELEEWGLDLSEVKLQIEPEEEKDEVPEPPKEARAKSGQVYKLGRHRLMCGDSTMIDDVEKLMDGQKADMVFTSPPYNAGKSESLSGNTHTTDNKYQDGYSDNKTQSEWGDLVRESLSSVMSFSEYQFYNIQMLSGNKSEFLKILGDYSNQIVDLAIWNKGHSAPAMAENVMNSCFEFIVIFSGKTNPSRAIKIGNFRGTVKNVFDVPPQRKNEFSSVHAATFPIDLPIKILKEMTFDGSIIVDNFCGTGTTLIACEQTNRICYGMELDPRYCDVIIKRYCNLTGANEEEIYASAMEKAA